MNDSITIITPQFERPWERDFDYIPQDDKQFHLTIENAPIDILIGMGFSKWDKYNAVVGENIKKPVSKKISIPVINAPNENFTFDVGRGNAPIEAIKEDKWILLFPGEWYNHIPDGFMVYGLSGETYPFKKGKSDNDTRFGCLPYGILK